MRSPIHYIPDLVVLHLSRSEILSFVIAMVSRHVRGMRLRHLNHIADSFLCIGNCDRVNKQSVDSRLYGLNYLIKPLLGDLSAPNWIESLRKMPPAIFIKFRDAIDQNTAG